MSFFGKGKDKAKDQKPASAGGKESFSLFKKPAAAEATDAESKGRFLTLIKGKGAVEEAAVAAPAASESSDVQEAAPVQAAQTRVEPPVGAPAAASAPTPAPAKNNSFSLRRKSTDVAVAESTVTAAPVVANDEAEAKADVPDSDAPAKKKSALKLPEVNLGKLFAKKEKEPKPAKAKKEKEAAKPRTSGKASLGASKDFHVFIELDNGKEFFWAVTANHIQEVDRKKVSRAASFSRADTVLKAPGPLSFKGAEDLALRELGEPVHVINRSKDLLSVYATAEERALTSSFRIFPGQQAIDKLVKDAKVTGKPVITGFVFKDQEDRTALCVLFYINAEGASTKAQITLNPDNMDFVITQFATSRKINKKDAELLLFNNADFLGQVNGLQAYPEERVWQGIPVSTLARGAAVVTSVGAGALMAWAGFNYVQVSRLQSSIAKLESQASASKEQTSKMVSTSIRPFAKAMSLDETVAFDLAQKVWQPGSKVAMLATLDKVKYDIKIPVNTGKQFNNRPSVDSTPEPDAIRKATNFEPPQGCNKDNTSVSGNLNEIQITVVCENPDSPLSGFRND